MYLHKAFEKLDPQNFAMHNRGDMFAPAGHMVAPLEIAQALTPGSMGHGDMKVFPVPHMYGPAIQPKMNVKGNTSQTLPRIGG